MFGESNYVVPPRPTYTGPCTCVWPGEYARQQVRARIERETSAKADAISNPIGALSSALPERMLPGGFQGVEQRLQSAADGADKRRQREQLDEFGRSTTGAQSVSRSPPLGSASRHAMLSTDSTIAVEHDPSSPQLGPGYGEFSEGDSEAGVPKPGHVQKYNPKHEDPRVADARARSKAQAKGKLANQRKPDTLGRMGKKYFAKSSKSPDCSSYVSGF
jgi:hypothetical protein